FQIRRARLSFSGHAFTKDFTYRVEPELVQGRTFTVSPGLNYGGVNLQDGWANYKLRPWVQFQVGQFKTYFNREEMTSTSQLQMVDYSLTNEAFSYHRDIGVAIKGDLSDKKFQYAFNIMNDGSHRNAANKNNMFLFTGRFVYNVLGFHGYTMGDLDYLGYSESALANGAKPQLAFGLASSYDRVKATQAAPNHHTTATTWDIIYRYSGFSFFGAGYYFHNLSQGNKALGFIGQSGYFLVPKRLEVAARYAGAMPTAQNVASGYELGAALNYFFHGHNLKLQADYNWLINSPLTYGANGNPGVANPANIVTTGGQPGFHQGQHDHQVRLQFQFYL
ncbi:MAG: porin, partial [bacterium]|nr:porin [bacterium]